MTDALHVMKSNSQAALKNDGNSKTDRKIECKTVPSHIQILAQSEWFV